MPRPAISFPGARRRTSSGRCRFRSSPSDLRPGDLVFLGARSGLVHHVGLYAGGGWVIAAPHHGALVEVEPLTAVPWDGFGRILQAPRGRLLSVRLVAGAIAGRSRSPSPKRT